MRTRPLLFALLIVFAVSASNRGTLAQAQRFTTPWGHPDLQGVWNNQTPVPLERPKELKDKARFTPEEAREYEKTHANRLQGFINTVEAVNACPPGGKEADCVESLAIWLDTAQVARNLRTFTAQGRHGRVARHPRRDGDAARRARGGGVQHHP